MSMKEISQRLAVESSDKFEGTHSIRISDDLASHLNERLEWTRGTNSPYFFERAGIGEDLGSAAVSKMGWNEIERHPFNRSGPGSDPHKTGTDILFRNRETRELIVVEFRYWKDDEAAMEDGLRRVERRRDDEESHPVYGDIGGAYVASLSLDLRSNGGELRVKRAW
jgi:hypothetical protein